jgi:hypothetical protein
MARRQSKQCGGILGARQVRHVAGVGTATSAPHARPRGIRRDRRHHAPFKPQFKTVPHKLHLTSTAFSASIVFWGERRQRQYIRGAVAVLSPSPNPARQEHAFWQKHCINAVTTLHQWGNSVVTNNSYGLSLRREYDSQGGRSERPRFAALDYLPRNTQSADKL